jgi:hypothetical protein
MTAMRVFISHSRTDRRLAEDLATRLSVAGFAAWSEQELFPGDNWPLAIGKALDQSEAMIVLVSPESAKSESVRNEILYALSSLQYANRVIPVQVRPTDEMPWILRSFATIPGDGDVEEVSRLILDRLREASEVAR